MSYRASQDCIVRAETLLRDGDFEAAQEEFRRGAELQLAFVEDLPKEKVRTKSAYGLSAATLFYRAGEFEAAERVAAALLAADWVELYYRSHLRELMGRIWDELLLREEGLRLSRNHLTLILRGGRIGTGLAPTDAVDSFLKAFLNLTRRMAAFMSGYALTKIAPRTDLEENYQTLMTSPYQGSYRVDLYLAAPAQTQFQLEGVTVDTPSPESVLDRSAQLVEAASSKHQEAVQKLVPDREYQTALVRLARNLVPDGKDVGEVELRRAERPRDRVVLDRGSREPMNALLRDIDPSLASKRIVGEQRTQQLVGTLRAVDLDAGKVRLFREDQPPRDFQLPSQILDDVIGPMLNRPVLLTLHREPGKKTWKVQDIERAPESMVASA